MDPSDIYKFNPINGKPLTKINDKLLKDEETGFKFFINPKPTTSAIILNDKDEILLVRRAFEPKKGMLDLPCGFIEIDESAEEGLKREIKEELGANATDINYLTTATNKYEYQGISEYLLDITFTCRLNDYNNLTPMDDIVEILFVPPKELKFEEIAFESIKNALKHYFNFKKK